MKKKRKISWRGARSWRQLWGPLRQNFHNFTTFWKSEKKGKNELELTSKLTSPPTKVFTSGKTSYTKTSLKKSPKLNRFFYQKLQFIVFFFKIFKSTLLKISLLFPNSSLRGPKRCFSSKNCSITPFDPLFSPDIFLRGGQTPNRSVGQQSGRTRSARDFWPPLRASQGGAISI